MIANSCAYWFEVARIILPALLIIIGWVIVHILSSKRDVSNSKREIISKTADDFCEVVDSLLIKANQYHSQPRNATLEIEIKITLSDLSLRISSLVPITKKQQTLSSCLQSVVSLRQAITREHFEDEHTSPIRDGAISEKIADAVLEMKRHLMQLKIEQL